MIQIPYAAIGIGVAVLFGVWAFLVAETVKARAVIAGAAAVVFLVGALFPTPAGRLISLLAWMIYGIGCIIFLKYNGLEIR
jgi:hypothetical protein